MKKLFKSYAICWAILFVLFNVIAIALPGEVTVGNIVYTKFAGLSLVTFIVIELAFVGHLLCTWVALSRETLTGTFYRLPLIRVSYAGAIVTAVIGILAMAVPNLPAWIPLILCVIVLALYAVAVVKAAAAAEVVEEIDAKVKQRTANIKNLILKAESVLSRAEDEPAKAACKKVFEAIRYSDPMSDDELDAIENQIGIKLNELGNDVKSGDAEKLQKTAADLLLLIKDRNAKCKLIKD